jgi:stage III sporulation protein SpoIIIAA
MTDQRDTSQELSTVPSADQQGYIDLVPELLRDQVVQLLPRLVEVRLDYGTAPTALLINGKEVDISEVLTELEEVEAIAKQVGPFNSKNRAAIDGALHRVSCNKTIDGEVIGITLRYGRPIVGVFDLLEDLFKGWLVEDRSGSPVSDIGRRSIGVLGVAGSGKTTLLRNAIAFGSQFFGKSVVAVDTSNELFGNGKKPHKCIGRARRFQSTPERMGATMIEVVENQTPVIIVVDQLSNRQDAYSAVTIRNRGTCLIGSVHAASLRGLVYNDELVRLIGGRDKETLGDKTMLRRGLDIKTVEISPGQPVFDVCVQLLDRESVLIYHDVSAAVAGILANKEEKIGVEFRSRKPLEVVKIGNLWSGNLREFETRWQSRPRQAAAA